jgi:hypothetical protein
MAVGGFRITEDGNLRVTQASEGRVTEDIVDAYCSLSASGSITSLATATINVATSLSNVGSAIFIGVAERIGASRLEAESTLGTQGSLLFNGVVNLPSISLASISGGLLLDAASTLSSSGSLAVKVTLPAEFTATSTGSLSTSPALVAYGYFDSLPLEQVRVTSAGDVRVTEDGLDTRVTNIVQANAASGSLVVFSTVFPFSGTPYVNQTDSWKQFTPYVKHSGEWVRPEKVYKNVNGNWKRVL